MSAELPSAEVMELARRQAAAHPRPTLFSDMFAHGLIAPSDALQVVTAEPGFAHLAAALAEEAAE